MNSSIPKNKIGAMLVAAASTLTLSSVGAIETVWTGAVSNDWANPGNWTAGVPTAADIANVNSMVNTPTVPGGVTVNELWAGGPGGVGAFNITAGTVTASGWTAVGRDNEGTGSISNATLNGRLAVGSFANGRGTFNIGSGATVYSNNDFFVVGETSGAQGRINQTGGVLTFDGGAEKKLGAAANSYGYYDLSAGTVNVNSTFQIGSAGVGVFRQSGGTATHAANTWAAIGRFTGGQGELTMTGGSQIHDSAGAGGTHFIIGENGTGVANVSGTALINTGKDVVIGGDNGSGTLNLGVGGVVQADRVRDMNGNNANGTSRLNFNGGTLKAGAGSAVTDFLGGLTSVTVHAGGAIIDSNGTDITVSQALEAPSGNGLTSIPVSAGGSGYLGSPYVAITGGGGVGATAVANIDGTGAITSFTITSPGTGYTSAPSVSLNGGEPLTAATLGAATTGVNVSGGLTKVGTGSLTLTGASTYTGPTLISAGTLKLGAGGSINSSSLVTVAAGATYDGSAAGGILIPVGQTLNGNGSLIGDTTVNGSLAPGTSIGGLAFTGNLTLAGTSVFEIDPSLGINADLATVSGVLTYGGSLTVNQIGGTLAFGQVFNLFDFGSLSGSFSSVSLPAVSGDDYWINNLATNGSITFIPEPTSMVFAGMGLLGFLRRRRA